MEDFWNWWQYLPTKMNPVIFEIGSFKLQYYGLMYIIAFGISYFLVVYRIKTEARFHFSVEQIKSIMTYMILGLILGARGGYVLFYNFSYYFRHPLEIILPFDFSNGMTFIGISGMSYHGGLIGVLLSAWFYTYKNRIDFWEMSDLFAPAVPLGYTFGRLGNFINGELYGRVTTSPIGMYFHTSQDHQLRHPSQLYEAFFEGIFLFIMLWGLRKKKMPSGSLLSFYLIGYGGVRFVIEYFRQPDLHLGFIFLSFTMGQLLCAFMMLCGFSLYLYLSNRTA